MKKQFLIFLGIQLLSFTLAFAVDFGECNSLFPKGKAPNVSTPLSQGAKALCFTDFAVYYSVKTKTPVYTIEKLNYIRLSTKVKRKDHFHEEYRLSPSERASLKDYARSGYDRGHNTPAGDCSNSLCMEDSFTLANMFPQSQKLNRGHWAKSVEAPTRKYAMRASGDIYVFTGGYYGANYKTIGYGKVGVPDYVWKLVYDSQKNKSWVFWLENSDDAKMSAPISYEEFVKKTGLKLLD